MRSSQARHVLARAQIGAARSRSRHVWPGCWLRLRCRCSGAAWWRRAATRRCRRMGRSHLPAVSTQSRAVRPRITRWTTGRAELTLPNLSGKYQLLRLRAHGWRPDGQPAPVVRLDVMGGHGSAFRPHPPCGSVTSYSRPPPQAGCSKSASRARCTPFTTRSAPDWLRDRLAGDPRVDLARGPKPLASEQPGAAAGADRAADHGAGAAGQLGAGADRNLLRRADLGEFRAAAVGQPGDRRLADRGDALTAGDLAAGAAAAAF